MSFDMFKQVILRVKELDIVTNVTLTGQGESTLHPLLLEFVTYASEQGVAVGMTTNANLLTREKSEALLAAGLGNITFSVSDMGADYELVYNLNFEQTRKNILDFLDLKDKKADPDFVTYISIVEHDLNREKISDMRKFWRAAGADSVLHFAQSNRGGACDNGHYFIGNSKYRQDAIDAMGENNVSTLCSAPFSFVFIGWNGQYYICCSDYKKEVPLGSVYEHDIDSLDHIKMNAYRGGLKPCVQCNIDPVNSIRELYHEIENGEATPADIEAEFENLKVNNHCRLPMDIDILKWENSAREVH